MTPKRHSKKLLKTIVVLALLGWLIFFSRTAAVKKIREIIVKLSSPALHLTMRPRQNNDFYQKLIDEKDRRIKELEFDLQKTKTENKTLKDSLNFKSETKTPLRGARVIFYSQELGREYLLVDQGRLDGIQENSLAIDDRQNIIGTVFEAGESFSKIDIASNPGNTWEIKLTKNGVRALAEGLGSRSFVIKLIPEGTVVEKGDFLSLARGDYGSFLLAEVMSSEKENSNFLKIKAVIPIYPETIENIFIVSSRGNESLK